MFSRMSSSRRNSLRRNSLRSNSLSGTAMEVQMLTEFQNPMKIEIKTADMVRSHDPSVVHVTQSSFSTHLTHTILIIVYSSRSLAFKT